MTSRRTRNIALTIFVLTILFVPACRRTQPAPPTPPPLAATPPPPPPAAAPTITLRASSTTIDRGSNTTLTWETRNAQSVRIEPGLGQVDANGNRQVNPTSSVTYTATATGPGGTATDTARITVNVPAPPPAAPAPKPTVTADPLGAFRKSMQDVYFDYDKADLLPAEEDKLRSGAAFLKQNPNVRFTIEGHADERGSDEYNIGLGDRRANAVKEFLQSQGVAASRMNTVSYGEERPQCRDESEDCFRRNRRAAFASN